MQPRLFFWISLVIAAALLAAGYILAGLVWIALPVLLLGFSGWLQARFDWPGLPPLTLIFYLILAGGGILLGVSPFWMVAGAGTALAAFELAPIEREQPVLDPPGQQSAARSRLALLAVSVLTSTALALAGLALRVAIPFAVTVLAGLLALFSLYAFFRLISQEKKP